jgi:hypothetical protein
MKKTQKTISLLLVIALLFTTFASTIIVNAEEAIIEEEAIVESEVFEEQAEHQDYITVEPELNKTWTTMKGDMNFDGVLDIVDYQQNVNFILEDNYRTNTTELNEDNILYDAADVNGDGAIDVLDAAALHIDITFGEPTQAKNYLGDAQPSGYFQTGFNSTSLIYNTFDDSNTSSMEAKNSYIAIDAPYLSQDPLQQIPVIFRHANTSYGSGPYAITFYRIGHNKYGYTWRSDGITLSDNGYYKIDKTLNNSEYKEMEFITKNNNLYLKFTMDDPNYSQVTIFNKTFDIPYPTNTFEINVSKIVPNRTITAKINFLDGTSKETKFYATEADGTCYSYWYAQDADSSAIKKTTYGTYEFDAPLGQMELLLKTDANVDLNGENDYLFDSKQKATLVIETFDLTFERSERDPATKFFDTIESVEVLGSKFTFPRCYIYDVLDFVYARYQDEIYVTDANEKNYSFNKTYSDSTLYFQDGCEYMDLIVSVYDFLNLNSSSNTNSAQLICTEPIDIETIKTFHDYENTRIVDQQNEEKAFTQVRYHYNFPYKSYDEEDEASNTWFMSNFVNDYREEYMVIESQDYPQNQEETVLVPHGISLLSDNSNYEGLLNPMGYEFIGWSTTPYPENIVIPKMYFGSEYSPNELTVPVEHFSKLLPVSADKPVNLYAIWQPVVTTIMYSVPIHEYNESLGYFTPITITTNEKYYLDSSGLLMLVSTDMPQSADWYYKTPKTNGLFNASTFGLKRTGYKFVGWKCVYSSIGDSFDHFAIYDQNDAELTAEQICSSAAHQSSTLILEAVWEKTT